MDTIENQPSSGVAAPSPGSETPSRRSDYYLHGFSFASRDERQAAAEGHPLWDGFLEYWSRRYHGTPSMDETWDRELYEFFVEGGWQEASQNDELCGGGPAARPNGD